MEHYINPSNVPESEFHSYEKRETARVVVFDKNGDVALVSIFREGVHKLPGGGIEASETPEEAALRECKEELGVDVHELACIGVVYEVHADTRRIQKSHCFTGSVIGEKGKLTLSPEEEARGFAVEWLPLKSAIQRIEDGGYQNEKGRFVFERERLILSLAADTI